MTKNSTSAENAPVEITEADQYRLKYINKNG